MTDVVCFQASDTIEGSVDKKSQLRQNEKKKRGRPPKFPAPKSPHTLTDEVRRLNIFNQSMVSSN